jgi:ubiquitin conjugation factor E4 B
VISIDAELKAQIDAFIAERRNKNPALNRPDEEVVKMDVSTD